jgi:uncharacterized protein (TIGR02452 family)
MSREKIITCAAPNRFTKILQIAVVNDNKRLILGAWGCGVFSNP